MSTNKIRVIKKYANRRLYDTQQSLYITLEELKKYVLEQIPFKVIDAKTEEDVTRSCLVQIILEMENESHKPFFSQEILENILRFYNNPLHEAMKDFLERYLNLIASQQKGFYQMASDPNKKDLFTSLTELGNQNMASWWGWWSKEDFKAKQSK